MKYSVLFVLVHSMITVPNNINESKGKSSKVRSDGEDQYNNDESKEKEEKEVKKLSNTILQEYKKQLIQRGQMILTGVNTNEQPPLNSIKQTQSLLENNNKLKDKNNSSSSPSYSISQPYYDRPISKEENDRLFIEDRREIRKNYPRKKQNEEKFCNKNNSSSSSSNYIIAIIVLLLVGCVIGYLLYYYQDNKTDVPQAKSMKNKG